MTALPSPTKTRITTWVTLAFAYVYVAWGHHVLKKKSVRDVVDETPVEA